MKFLCLACDEAMRLASAAGPDEGSLTVTFHCPRCGHQVAMLTNPWETQLVKTLGVKVGTPGPAPAPFASLRAGLAHQRDGAFAMGPATTPVAGVPASPREGVGAGGPGDQAAAPDQGPGCPFAAMIPGLSEAATGDGPTWTPEAEARIDRIPVFVRPMAKMAIERYARERGYAAITQAVMDEAREGLGL
jgi:Proto-chlorophyllide reductase 57 kD subunit